MTFDEILAELPRLTYEERELVIARTQVLLKKRGRPIGTAKTKVARQAKGKKL